MLNNFPFEMQDKSVVNNWIAAHSSKYIKSSVTTTALFRSPLNPPKSRLPLQVALKKQRIRKIKENRLEILAEEGDEYIVKWSRLMWLSNLYCFGDEHLRNDVTTVVINREIQFAKKKKAN